MGGARFTKDLALELSTGQFATTPPSDALDASSAVAVVASAVSPAISLEPLDPPSLAAPKEAAPLALGLGGVAPPVSLLFDDDVHAASG
jgi:hypothetical protein